MKSKVKMVKYLLLETIISYYAISTFVNCRSGYAANNVRSNRDGNGRIRRGEIMDYKDQRTLV